MVRLNKWIADSGLCSRREADRLIEAGEVTINGKVETAMGCRIDPTKDRVRVRGKALPKPRKVYLLFHKPAGVITTRSDEKHRKTIYDLLPERYHDCDPAGRLDRETSGALILSNDGDFIHRITHPRFHVEKRYRVTLDRALTEGVVRALLAGIELLPEKKLAKALYVEMETPKVLQLGLVTGYNRQVRRMFEGLGYEVKSLKRMAFGAARLKDLKPGDIRPLLPSELRRLGQEEGSTSPAKPEKGQRTGQNKHRPAKNQGQHSRQKKRSQ